MELTEQHTKKIFDSVRIIYERLHEKNSKRNSITPSEYDRHREDGMWTSATIIKKISWSSVLSHLGIAQNLSRNVRATLSNALHVLHKRIIRELSLGWEEINLVAPTNSRRKIFRPDSICMDSLYLQNDRILALDVKLSIQSAAQTVYKYLPIFQNGLQKSLTDQQTFFPEWLPKNAINVPEQVFHDGQMAMFWENHILYICYLLGEKMEDLSPGSFVSALNQTKRRRKIKGQKKIFNNMEVRFVHFNELPQVYCDIAGIRYGLGLQQRVEPIMELAELISAIAEQAGQDSLIVAKHIYRVVKDELDCQKAMRLIKQSIPS